MFNETPVQRFKVHARLQSPITVHWESLWVGPNVHIVAREGGGGFQFGQLKKVIDAINGWHAPHLPAKADTRACCIKY